MILTGSSYSELDSGIYESKTDDSRTVNSVSKRHHSEIDDYKTVDSVSKRHHSEIGYSEIGDSEICDSELNIVSKSHPSETDTLSQGELIVESALFHGDFDWLSVISGSLNSSDWSLSNPSHTCKNSTTHEPLDDDVLSVNSDISELTVGDA
jgi:hypothetical protein